MTPRPEPPPPYGRIALILVFVILTLTVAVSLYLAAAPGNAGGLPAGADPERDSQRLLILLLLLLMSGVVICAFLLGAYLLLRAGKTVTKDRVGGAPTAVEDLWSRGRVRQADLDAAEAQLREYGDADEDEQEPRP